MKPELQKILEISSDFSRYCDINLKIKTKSGEILPLKFKPIQKIILDKVLDDLANGRPVRYIILKARQEGVSTLVEALIYWWTATHQNVKAKIVAHDQDTAEVLFGMFTRYYENSNIIFKPTTKYNTRNDLTFDTDAGDGLKSQIDVATAKNTGTGRGQTIQWLHGSEISLWPDGSELMAGLMQAVPKLPNTAIFLESTANGLGDFFHKTWQAAKAGNSVFNPLFFKWSDDPTYVLPVPTGFKLTDEEKQLKIEHELTDEQICWRRETMKEFADDERKFHQEYPLTDIEAFLASGNSRFNTAALIKMDEKCFEPKTYDLIEVKPDPGKVSFGAKPTLKAIESLGSPLKIWRMPVPVKKYVIGCDVAEGIGGDYSVASVMDEDEMETVARWRGDCEPAEFGEILNDIGKFYNRALIACEINNHGLTTVQRLRDLHYDNLYRQERGVDERFEEYTSKLGWKTDRKTKPLMINALSEAIYTNKIKDYDSTFVRECLEFVIDDRGKTGAQIGCHDDCFIKGTLILTDSGNKPIEDIRTGDLVLTLNGFRPVGAIHNSIKPVVGHLGLVGTPDHPVITTECDKSLQMVDDSDTLYIWNDKLGKIEKLSYTEAKNTTDILIHQNDNCPYIFGDTINGKNRLNHFIGKYGLIILERYLKVILSIIETTTHSITTLKTYVCLKKASTQNSICKQRNVDDNQVNQQKNRETDCSLLGKNGVKQPKLKSLRKITSLVRCCLKSLDKLSANIVRLSLKLRIVLKSIVLKSALIGFIITKPLQRRRVYNLQVIDTPQYFANNILVHNCVISTAIALQVFDWNDAIIKSRQVRSKIPQKYSEIRKKMAGISKK